MRPLNIKVRLPAPGTVGLVVRLDNGGQCPKLWRTGLDICSIFSAIERILRRTYILWIGDVTTSIGTI